MNTIKIGVDLPLTGADGRAGTPTLNGVRFFVSQHPTVGGYTVVIDARDDAVKGVHNPGRGAGNVRALAADPLVLGVIGPFDSGVARAEIPVANAAALAMVSPATTSRCLTKEPFLPAKLNPARTDISCADAGLPAPKDLRPSGVNNYFRLAATDDLQGPAAADHAYKTLHLIRVAVLSDHESYGQGLAASFRARFDQLGGRVVAHADLDPSANVDLASFMQLAKQDGAQAIYYGGITANGGCTIRAQMASVFGSGETAPYLGGDGIVQDPACIRDAGANAAGVFATLPALHPESIPTAKPVIAAFTAQYRSAADYGEYTVAAYDATGVLYGALERAIRSAGGKRPPRGNVISELSATTAYAGATGAFGFDAAGDTTQRVVSIFESPGPDPRAAWTWVGAVDYSVSLPY